MAAPKGPEKPKSVESRKAQIENYRNLSGFTDEIENFDTEFKLEKALEYDGLSAKDKKDFNSANRVLGAWDAENIFDEFKSTERKDFITELDKILKAKLPAAQIPTVRPNLIKAWDRYIKFKEKCKEIHVANKAITDSHRKERDAMAKENGVLSDVGDWWDEAKEKLGDLGTGEKIGLGVAALIGISMLLNAEKGGAADQVKAWSFTGVKVVVLGWLSNTLTKVATGKGWWERIFDEETAKSVKENKYFNKMLPRGTDEERNAFGKSMVAFGDMKFVDIAKMYRDAKESSEKEIDLVTVKKEHITKKESFMAMDIFFKNRDKKTKDKSGKQLTLEEKYKGFDDLTWAEVAAMEFSGKVGKPAESSLSDKEKVAGSKDRDDYKFEMKDGCLAWAYELYESHFQRPGSPEEVLKWSKENFAVQTTEANLENLIRIGNSPDRANGFINALNDYKKKPHPIYNLGTHSDGKSRFVVIRRPVKETGKDALYKATDDADAAGRRYLEKEYKGKIGDDINKFVEFVQSGYITDARPPEAVVFLRIPEEGTDEFAQRKVDLLTHEPGKKETEVFNGKFEWNTFNPIDKQRFLTAWPVKDGETVKINKILEWASNKYQIDAISYEDAVLQIFNPGEDVNLAIRSNIFTPDTAIMEGHQRLNLVRDKFKEIEEDIADKHANGDDEVESRILRKIREAYGSSARLAVIGEPSAVGYWNRTPNITPNIFITDPKKFLEEVYEPALVQKFEDNNTWWRSLIDIV